MATSNRTWHVYRWASTVTLRGLALDDAESVLIASALPYSLNSAYGGTPDRWTRTAEFDEVRVAFTQQRHGIEADRLDADQPLVATKQVVTAIAELLRHVRDHWPNGEATVCDGVLADATALLTRGARFEAGRPLAALWLFKDIPRRAFNEIDRAGTATAGRSMRLWRGLVLDARGVPEAQVKLDLDTFAAAMPLFVNFWEATLRHRCYHWVCAQLFLVLAIHQPVVVVVTSYKVWGMIEAR
jgi:hypothetical protein